MPIHELTLLGGLTLAAAHGRPVGRVAQRRRLAVLTTLALAGARGMSRDRLLALLWPESDAESARHLLSDSIYVIRRELGEGSILGNGGELRLNEAVVRCDVATFEAAIAAGELERAVEVYGGPLLDGFHLADSPELERWIDAERDRLARRHAAAVGALAAERDAAGDAAGAVAWLRRLAAAEPYDTTVAARLVRALGAAGDVGGAQRHAHVHALLLRQELECEAGPELAAALADAIALAETRAAAPTAVAAPPSRAVVAQERAGTGRVEPADRTARAGMPVRLRRLGGGILLAGLLIVAGFLTLRPAGSLPAGGLEAVAIFPFTVRGTDSTRVADALHVLLSTRMDGAGGMPTLDPHALAARLPKEPLRPERAAAIAASLGAGAVVLGDVVITADRIELSATRYTAGRPLRRTARGSVDGPADDLFHLVDRLAAQLMLSDDSSSVLTRTAALTSTSLPALKRFLDGERYYRAGDIQRSAAEYAEAVALDSTFALAHLRLALAQEWGAGGDGGRRATEQALLHGERLPPRARQLVEAHAARRRGEYALAEQSYRRLLERYPDEVDGWNGLGETLYHGNPELGRSWLEAREPFERARSLGHRVGGEPIFHLLAIAAAEERPLAFDTLTREYLRIRPDGFLSTGVRAHRVLMLGDTAQIAIILHELQSMSTGRAEFIVLLAAINTYRFAEAGRLLARLEAAGHARSAARDRLVHVRLAAARWRWREAMLMLEGLEATDRTSAVDMRALLLSLPFAHAAPDALRATSDALRALPTDSINPERRLYLGALLQLRQGNVDSAVVGARALERLPGDRPRAWAAHLRAAAAHRDGNTAEALRHLQPALAGPGGAQFRLLRGELLLETGAAQEAIGWFHAATFDSEAPLFHVQADARIAQAYRILDRPAEAQRYERRFMRVRHEN